MASRRYAWLAALLLALLLAVEIHLLRQNWVLTRQVADLLIEAEYMRATLSLCETRRLRDFGSVQPAASTVMPPR